MLISIGGILSGHNTLLNSFSVLSGIEKDQGPYGLGMLDSILLVDFKIRRQTCFGVFTASSDIAVILQETFTARFHADDYVGVAHARYHL